MELLKSECFDLVLCDLVMPEISGRDVINLLDTLDKRPKVGLIIGWSEEIVTTDEGGLNVDFFVKKPFDFSMLSKHINEVVC
jgi:CheY-like chemotaxis protein